MYLHSNEILHLATLGVKSLATYVVLPSMQSCHLYAVLQTMQSAIHISMLFILNARSDLWPGGIVLFPECALLPTECCNSNALPIKTNILIHSSSIHYRDRGIVLFPECASSLTEPYDSDTYLLNQHSYYQLQPSLQSLGYCPLPRISSSLTEPCNSDALPIQSTQLTLVIQPSLQSPGNCPLPQMRLNTN